MRAQERREMRTADLLLALDEKNQVHRQIALRLQRLDDALDVGENLPLVIARPARGDDAVLHAGLKRRVMPEHERVDRLHVVVAVNQHGRPALAMRPAREHHEWPGVGMIFASSPAPVSFARSHSAQASTCALQLESVEMLPKRRNARNSSRTAGVGMAISGGVQIRASGWPRPLRPPANHR